MKAAVLYFSSAHIGVFGNAQLAARAGFVGLHGNHLGQRVADVGHGHASLLVDLLLEGEDHQHVRHRLDDFLDAPAAPCPDLRPDVVHGRDAGVAQLRFQPEVEARVVGADKAGRPVRQQLVAQRVLDAFQLAVAGNDLEQPAHRHFFNRPVRLETMFHHGRAADAVEARVGQVRTQPAQQAACQQVAGRFAGDYCNRHVSGRCHG
jgi:hypothetical protein